MFRRALLILFAFVLLPLASSAYDGRNINKSPLSSNLAVSAADTVAPASGIQDKQEETVYITKTGQKYHRAGCRYLSKSKIPIKRKDAIARGYDACKVCKP